MEYKRTAPMKPSNELKINVMMVGGRRCGKTSVLSAMQSCFESQFGGMLPFVISSKGATVDELEEKRNEVREYFLCKEKSRTFVPDSNPTFDVTEYPFDISLKDSKNRIKINFIDFPGEWWNNSEYGDKLKKRMNESRILLIAIDTPHLMEEDGLYNDRRNRCFRITEMVKQVGFADVDKGAGLILLIPLKCERYLNDGRMEEVRIKAEKEYEQLIQYVKQPGNDGKRSLCQIAVTPIFTMGGAAFDKFERNSDMEIDIDPQYKTPKKAIYYFPDMTKKEPEPKYCEQPLLYVLKFTFEAAQGVLKKANNSKNPLLILSETLSRFLKNLPVNPLFSVIADFLAENISALGGTEDYLKYADEIDKRLKKSGDGYRILT